MKAERLIHPIFTLLLTLSCGDLHEDQPVVVTEVDQPAQVSPMKLSLRTSMTLL